ncbi:DNA polymerase IV [Bacillus piscicola]|uniref:DNA polymerase IV n=1 Tax=Bacillus piscicola TaxID=1632684 RepID=UPI001F09D096|nr:DNA polymerase IV [Bacillus piscicola]
MGKAILLCDMVSFYASVEKLHRPDLDNKPVVVAGDPERRSGVILAACPVAKRYGVKTAMPLWEAQNHCPHVVVIKPRMQTYIEISLAITELMQSYTDKVEIFSIDEQFLEVDDVVADQVAASLQEDILRHLGLQSRVGIGTTKSLAKMACDHFAKKNNKGIYRLRQDQLEDTLWPLDIGKLFGVGKRMEAHFRNMAIRTIGQLANYPVDLLQKRWGINGVVLHQTAWGIDSSPVSPNTHNRNKAIGHHITLPKDYALWKDIRVPLQELSEEVARRVRANGYMGKVVGVGAGGQDLNERTGFHRQVSLHEPTNDGKVIYQAAKNLFDKFWDGYPIRSLGVSLNGLEDGTYRQLSLFESSLEREELNETVDSIKERYGADAIMYATSLTAAGLAKERAKKIGGHYR